MSNAIFPSTLGGYAWDSKKKPVFNNITHSPVTGRDVRISLYNQPVYEFTLANNWLTKADKDTLMAFFVARRGSFDSFLYSDEDSVITAQPFAMGNGVNTAFQLTRTVNGAVEIVNNPLLSALYLDDDLLVAGVNYSLGAAGVVTMTAPIAGGKILSWTGVARYRCIFLADSLEYSQFANLLYECNEIQFKGSLAGKL